MTYHGRIESGQVVFDSVPNLPDGTEVVVTVLQVTPAAKPDEEVPTIYEQLKPFIGSIEGLPADASMNVDHYLYGHPKK